MEFVAIFGLMRSGTTWIGKVLDSSPDVIYLHEPDYVKRIPCLPYTTDINDYSGWEPFIRSYLQGLRSTAASRSMLKRPSFPKSFSSTIADRIAFNSFLGMLRVEQLLNRVGFAPVPFTWPRCVDHAKFTVWKSVEQTGNVGCFLRAVPEQKVLHVVRHPCGFVDSVMRGQRKKLLRGGVPATEDLGIFDYVVKTRYARELGLKLRDWKELSEVQRLAYVWLVINEQAILDGEGMPNYKLVYFEEFCFNPMQKAAEVYDFIGLDFGPQTKRFVDTSSGASGDISSTTTNRVGGNSNGYYSVNRDSASVPRSWERRLSKESIDQILKIARLSDRMSAILDKPIGEAKPRVD